MKIIITILCLFLQATSIADILSPNLTAQYDANRKTVFLKWQHKDPRFTAYVLQRSDDNKNWSDIYVLTAGNFKKKKQEKFADKSAGTTKNFYRLRMFTDPQSFEYSPSILVIIGSRTNNWVLYPVPVKDVLNLQYNGSEPIRGVVGVIIQNMNGYVLIRKRYSSLNRTIQVPVDNLGKGIYDIRIVVNNAVVWNQRFAK